MSNMHAASEYDRLLDCENRATGHHVEDQIASRRRSSRSVCSILPTIRQTLRPIVFTFLLLLPSFVRQVLCGESGGRTPSHKISSLDGLRGFACLFVFNYHWARVMGHYQHGVNLLDEQHSTLSNIQRWPFLHIVWNGVANVYIFFAISGYVLSYKAVGHIRSGTWESLQASLASSTFRRALRLYVPSIALCFMIAMALQLHMFDRGAYNRGYINDRTALPNITLGRVPARLDTFGGQLWHVFKACGRLLASIVPWSTTLEGAPEYAIPLWTIPIEFRCSIVVFSMLMGTSRLRARYRLLMHMSAILYCFYMREMPLFLFLSGMTLVEIDAIRQERSKSPAIVSGKERTSTRQAIIFQSFIFICGLYLASVPDWRPDTAPGFNYLVSTLNQFFNIDTGTDGWNPKIGQRLRAPGAVMVMWSAANFKAINSLFTNTVSSYLGRISFALYLVQNAIFNCMGLAILPWLYKVGAGTKDVPEKGISQFGHLKAWLLGYVLLLAVNLWAADLLWRAVDEPSVKFARWLERRITR